MNFKRDILVLTQQDLMDAGCFDMKAAVRVAEEALRDYAAGDVIFPDKVSVVFDQATQDRINCLPAGFKNKKVYGMKWVSVFPDNPHSRDLPNLSATKWKADFRLSLWKARCAPICARLLFRLWPQSTCLWVTRNPLVLSAVESRQNLIFLG